MNERSESKPKSKNSTLRKNSKITTKWVHQHTGTRGTARTTRTRRVGVGPSDTGRARRGACREDPRGGAAVGNNAAPGYNIIQKQERLTVL